jgi:hypothetical protein
MNTPNPSTTSTMSIGGPGGINMSNGPNGRQMSIGGPGGINMYNGPNGRSMSIGGPGEINYTNYGAGGDSDDNDWEVSGALVKDPWDWPWGVSINSNNNYGNINFGVNQINNGWGPGNFYGANFGNRNSPFGFKDFSGPYGNNWGSNPQSQWPPHVLAQYQQGMTEGARGLAEGAKDMERAAEEMSNMGTGMGPWGMGPWGMGPWGTECGHEEEQEEEGEEVMQLRRS